MASDINTMTVVGRLTRDAETRNVGDKQVASFSIANGYYSKQNNDAVNYFDCELWSPGGLLQYLVKGKQVAVAGELRQERWQQDGQNRSRIKIMIRNIQLVGGRDNGHQGQSSDQSGSNDGYSDDIPF